ncbi:neutral zinc metallopeptidase [Baekduia sp. Peel2402]|uniref:neutral zinc metallopeptidase n=1 Tax=Baekduia sp. Peel2402 TaxID=3458296 RepID=UPI00403EC571
MTLSRARVTFPHPWRVIRPHSHDREGGSFMRRAALLVVMIAAIAGCGDSGDTTTTTGTTAAAATTTATATATTPPAATTSAPAIESPDARKMNAPVAISGAPDPSTSAAAHADAAFLRASFDSAQDLWQRQFAAAGSTFRPGHLVLFHTQVATPCGTQTIDTGPFYCPAADTVYLNTDFFDALARAFDLRSGFAAAYVTAHEVAHHVQSLLGVLQRKAQADAADPDGANRRSILTELQADCYAGVWLHELAGAGQLSDADLEAIVRAAAVVGDDFQRNAAGRPLAPETWTHGSSEQRVRWLKTGLRSGSPAECDTFGAADAGTA